jgi:hypothetical protein
LWSGARATRPLNSGIHDVPFATKISPTRKFRPQYFDILVRPMRLILADAGAYVQRFHLAIESVQFGLNKQTRLFISANCNVEILMEVDAG